MAKLDNVEETSVDVPPEAGTDAYNKQMAEKFDASQGTEQSEEATVEETPVEVAAKPDGVPDKFYNKETGEVDYASLTKSYNELEKGRGKAKPKPQEALKVSTDDAVVLAKVKYDEAKEKAEADGATQGDKDSLEAADEALTLAKAGAITAREDSKKADEAQALVEKSGFNFDELAAEYADKGELSADSIEGLVKGGIPEATIHAYIAGQEALAAQWDTEAKEVAGGKEAYAEMIAWAGKALTPEEIKAYDTAVNTSDINQVKLAISGLRAKYEDSNGKEPRLLGGSTGGNQSTGGFGSRAEMIAAMSDPRYGNDPSYRKQVEAKVGKTTAF